MFSALYFTIVTIFIFLYLFIAIFWNIDFPIADQIKNKLRSTIIYSGLWHSWLMFTNPYKYNYNILAKLIYDDDTIDFIEICSYEDNLFLGKIKYSRLSKLIENLVVDNSEFGIRKFFCHFILERYSLPNKKVVQVELICEKDDIPDFWNKKPSHSHQEIIYIYRYPA